jgi:hypothetical protein
MSLRTQRKGQIGVNAVERVVLKEWESRWQPIDAFNDDGIDGLIFIEAGGVPTGQIVFAQVKYRTRQKYDEDDNLEVAIAPAKLRKVIEKWGKVIGAAIMICVDPEAQDVRWADIRHDSLTNRSKIVIPPGNKFNGAALKKIAALCGTINRDFALPRIMTTAEDFAYLKGGGHIQTMARQYYRSLNESGLYFKGSPSKVRFTREGWHHLTRRSRSRLTQLQSFYLLGALPAIVRMHQEAAIKIVTLKKQDEWIEYAAMRAAVSFPFRQTAVIAALFRRRTQGDGTYSYSFHTVYEPRRRKNLIGN